ncbi:hypothetical protein ACWEWL_10345 [Streptomyces rochei]
MMIGESLCVGVLGAGLIVGAGFCGVCTGTSAFAAGDVGLMCALGLFLYLLLVRAGRAMVGIVAILAVGIALRTPRIAAGVVFTARGQERSVVVTSVQANEEAPGVRGRYFWSVEYRDGAPSSARIWRGVHTVHPAGDELALVYDPKGLVPPRGVEGATSVTDALTGLAGWVASLLVACVIAVVRSFRPLYSPGRPGSDRTGDQSATRTNRP